MATPDLGALEPVLVRTARRIRLARILASLGYALAAGLSIAALQALWTRVARGEVSWRAGGLCIAVSLALAALVSACLRVRREDAARRLDLSHALHDRVRSAVEFAARGERSRFMEAALRDAAAKASVLSAERAVQLERPRGACYALLPLALWLAIGFWPAPAATVTARQVPTKARALSNDDLQAFRTELTALVERTALTPETDADVKRYNALLEQLGTGELSRAEALEALLSLEKKLLDAQGSGGEPDRVAMQELANDLAKAQEALSQALSQSDAERAARELEALAQRMKQESLDENERKQLRDALDKTRAREELRAQRDKREQELESLLKKKKPPGEREEPAEKSLFERNKRELERLRRDRAEEQKRSRQLSRLSRELSDASRAMGESRSREASDAMQRGAESLRKFGNENLTREQREDLRKQVEQLREMLQRQGNQGTGQQQQNRQGQDQQDQAQGGSGSRAQRFVLRAQGQDPDGQQAQLMMQRPQGQGGQQGQEGKEGEQAQGQQGQGQQGQGGQPGQQGKQGGQGSAGSGGQDQQGEQGKDKQQVMVLGGEGPAQGVLELPNLDGQGGSGSELVQTEGASDEHDPRKLRSPTEMDAKHEDSRLAGTAGKGPTRSEVILDAADRGFVTSGYRKVYSDYRSHAEDVLERDEIPPGYRFYVRRYFQLIRPRSNTGREPSSNTGRESSVNSGREPSGRRGSE